MYPDDVMADGQVVVLSCLFCTFNTVNFESVHACRQTGSAFDG